MQKNILLKCVDELKKPSCRIDYVVGMLETLVEMDASQTIVTPYVPSYPLPMSPFSPISTATYISPSGTNVGVTQELTDEEKLAQRYAGGPIGTVQ